MPYVLAGDVNETGNFTQLNALLDDSLDNVNLTMDYEHVDGDEDIVMSKSMLVNGNGHSLNGNGSFIVLSSNDSSYVFENVNFIDVYFKVSNGSCLNLSFADCNFTFNNSTSDVYITMESVPMLQHTGKISLKIKKLAKSIVGNSKDLKAAKKLANWVAKKIRHETLPGFYQTAKKTLKRKKGNCCCKADLFLQMCAAIGLDKNHELYYVHLGTLQFKQRHFFAMVDNRVVDVDGRVRHPWGHALFKHSGVFRITPYPYLPIPRS